jgi:hypothetical protein
VQDRLHKVFGREEVKLTGKRRDNKEIGGGDRSPSRRRDTTPTVDNQEFVLLTQMLDFLKQILFGEM